MFTHLIYPNKQNMCGFVRNYRGLLKNSFLLTLLFFAACSKPEDDSEELNYLVSYVPSAYLPVPLITLALSEYQNAYPELSAIIENTKYSIQVYLIEYKTHYLDSEIIASGLVSLPLVRGSLPMISFQNGTITLKEDAPSVNPSKSDYRALQALAGNGYIFLMPDYPGFGTSAELIHPYYHRVSTHDAVIDMIHACNELLLEIGNGVRSNDSIFLMGYSQGGWATMSALQEIENAGNTGLDVIAASCGAGAYDLMKESAYFIHQETFTDPFYLPYFIYTHQSVGEITDPLENFFQEPYAGRIPDLFNGLYDFGDINDQLTDTISDLLTESLIQNFVSNESFAELRTSLSENSIVPWQAKAKIRLYHGTADQLVPYELSQDLYNGFIDAGTDPARVNLIDLTGLNHTGGIIPFVIQSVNWFNTL
jgi:pimeloyl-ACP methyl ester carboxylesterase